MIENIPVHTEYKTDSSNLVGRYVFSALLILTLLKMWCWNLHKNLLLKYVFNFQYLNISFCLLIILILVAYSFLRQRYSYWYDLGVKCSKPLPIFGHTLRRLGITMHILQYYNDLYYNLNGKDFCGYYDFMSPGLVVGNLELLKSILVKDFDHFANRRVLQLAKINPIANNMLSNATGEQWRQIRTTISPVFTSHKLKQLYPLVCTQADEFVNVLGNMGQGRRELKMKEVCGQYTMDTIASCAFGIECEAMNSDRALFAEMASKIFVVHPIRALKLLALFTVPYLIPLIKYFGCDFTSDEFHFFHKVVTKTLRMREEQGIRRGDFLDLMKDTGNLTETTITSQCVLFLLAGHNNTANALSFTLHLLAVHPDIQEELRQELNDALNKTDEERISFERLIKLPLLDGVIKESLRLYPSDPTIERVCTKDYQIPGTNVTIRKNQSVIVPINCIHHDPQHWSEPECFKPQRFINVKEQDLGAYLPFGAGPRQCIGMKFVYLVVKVGLLKILTNFEVVPSANTVQPPLLSPRCFLSLQPIKGLPLALVPIPTKL